MRNGGVHLPNSADGLYQFSVPKRSEVRSTALLKDTAGSSAEEAGGVSREFQVNWGHLSVRQFKRPLVDAEGPKKRLLYFAYKVVGQCEVCQGSSPSGCWGLICGLF